MNLGNEFLEIASRRLSQYKELGEKALLQLQEAEFHYSPNETCNSIAVIVKHLAGNMLSRWTDFLTADGEKEWRNRDAEFEWEKPSGQEVLDYWEKGWKCCLDAIHSLREEDLLKKVQIRGEGLTVMDAIMRQMAHYPYHVGQIIAGAKSIKGENWENLSIPKGNSEAFNLDMKKKGPDRHIL